METFIRSYTLPDVSVCDKIIQFFENNTQLHQPGYFNTGIKETKVSTDISILINQEWLSEYRSGLQSCIDQYKKDYNNILDTVGSWGIVENVNIQRYNPYEGYLEYHADRTGFYIADRMMVFMTYLNDVKEGGETEWYFQKMKIKPRKGLTIIWPTDWNFLHRQTPTTKETMYTLKGWYNYYLESTKEKSKYEWNIYG